MVKAQDVHKILGEHILADGMQPVMDLEKSHDSYIVDARDDSEYLDMFSMYASSSVGYNHPYIKDRADWLGKIAVNKPAMSDMYNTDYAEFVKVFDRVAIPEELPYLFFIDGGALAVENALKVAFDWKTRKNMEKGLKTLGDMVIHFEQAFHGRSGYTMSLTNTADPRKYMYFPKFDWPRVKPPMLKFPITEENLAETIAQEKNTLQAINQAIIDNPDRIAALIIEPIQSEGGDNHFRNEFLLALREICDKNEIFLIFDEVQTGIAMTGTMWAFQQTGVVPDAIAFGKKTQVCGCLVSKRVEEVKNHCFAESSRINSTFGGNLVDMMRFKLILEIIERDNLVDNANKLGKYLINKVNELSTKFPELVSNVRGKGLIVAFDMPTTALRNEFRDLCMQNKLIILGCGTESVRFRPHLTVTKEELDKAISICELCLANLSVEV